MSRWKKLKGVAHNFSHHCQSGLSFIQPHISDELMKINKFQTEFQLYPQFETELNLQNNSPLKYALISSSEKFFTILNGYGFEETAVKEVRIRFTLQKYGDYDSRVTTKIISSDDRKIEGTVDFIIQPVSLVR